MADLLRDTLERRNAEALKRYQQNPQRAEILRRWYAKPTFQRFAVQARLGIPTTGIPL
jgi:hypothetical protein